MSLGLGSCTFEVLLGDALEEGCHCQNPPKMSDMPIPPPLHATMKISRIMMCACVAYVEVWHIICGGRTSKKELTVRRKWANIVPITNGCRDLRPRDLTFQRRNQ